MGDETPMEQARRHLREADERIARRETILAELERTGGHREMVSAARSLLTTLRATRGAMRKHLDFEKARGGG
jgi:hypothetical protein